MKSSRVTRELPLSAIEIDGMPFARVLDFVAAFRNGVQCKPIKVAWNPRTSRWAVRDGRHRYMAMKLLGRKEIPVRHAAQFKTPLPKKEKFAWWREP